MKTNKQLSTEAIGFPPTKMTEDEIRKMRISTLRRDFARIKKTSSLTGLKVLLKKEEEGKRKSTLIIQQLKFKIQKLELEQRQQASSEKIITNDNYWDCNCKSQFIHKNVHRTTCPKCEASRSDQPDSRQNEIDDIKNHFTPKILKEL